MERRNATDGTQPQDLSYYASLARRHLVVLILAPLLLAALAFFVSNSRDRQYSATTQVLLRPNDPIERLGSSTASVSQVTNIEQYVRSQSNLVRSADIRAAVADVLQIEDNDLIEDALRVNALVDSNTLEIVATSDSPEWSKRLADTVASTYIDDRRQHAIEGIELAIDDIDQKIEAVQRDLRSLSGAAETPALTAEVTTLTQQFGELSSKKVELGIDLKLKRGEAELVSAAELPTDPVSPRPLRTTALGFMLGLLVATGSVLLRDRLDVRLRSREEAEAISGLSALGEIPFDKSTAKGNGVAIMAEPNGHLAESIRSMRVSLDFLSLDDPIRVLLVTSATPADGKSTTSANLAGSFAESGLRTLLVSADLRRPSAETFAAAGASEPGFVGLLSTIRQRMANAHGPRVMDRGRNGAPLAARQAAQWTKKVSPPPDDNRPIEITEWCHAISESLWVLPAGQVIANPIELLGSQAAREFFDLARGTFDMVIVDSPPVIAVADAIVLSRHVDGILLVTSVGRTTRTSLRRAVDLLAGQRDMLLGLAVNRVGVGRGYQYRYATSVVVQPVTEDGVPAAP